MRPGGVVYCTACGQPLPALPPVACRACGAMQWNDAKPCACALVVSDAKLLLIRRAQEPWQHMWDVPGGFCDADEHPVDTAEREVREETGLAVRVVGFLGIWLDEYQEPGAAAKRTMNIFYHAVPTGPIDLRLRADEVVEAAFFAAPEMPASLAFPGHLPVAIQAWSRATQARVLTTPLFDRAGTVAGL